jgi:hypothetical protein
MSKVCKWSLETKSHFLEGWSQRIQLEDPTGWKACGGDVYTYLLKKLEHRVEMEKNLERLDGLCMMRWRVVN